MTSAVIRILTEDDDFDFRERREPEGLEDIFRLRIDGFAEVFGADKVRETLEFCCVKIARQLLGPTWLNFYLTHHSLLLYL